MSKLIGKKVVVRGDRSGVFFGTLKEKNGKDVVLTNARKLYYWKGACAVEQIAIDGVANPDECKFTVTVGSIALTDAIQILPCTEKSIKCIESVKEWKK